MSAIDVLSPEVLIVEDEEHQVDFLYPEFEAMGARHSIRRSPDLAREFLRRETEQRMLGRGRFAIVLDLMFPSDPQDGLGFLDDIRQGKLGIDKDTLPDFFRAKGYAKDGAMIEMTVSEPMQARPDIGGSTFVVDIIDVMTFDDAGKITTMRAYWDPAEMRPADDA